MYSPSSSLLRRMTFPPSMAASFGLLATSMAMFYVVNEYNKALKFDRMIYQLDRLEKLLQKSSPVDKIIDPDQSGFKLGNSKNLGVEVIE